MLARLNRCCDDAKLRTGAVASHLDTSFVLYGQMAAQLPSSAQWQVDLLSNYLACNQAIAQECLFSESLAKRWQSVGEAWHGMAYVCQLGSRGLASLHFLSLAIHEELSEKIHSTIYQSASHLIATFFCYCSKSRK